MDQKKIYDALYKFTTADFEGKPFLKGILHKDGYMVASNAYTLAKVHNEEYDFDYEELIIDEAGKVVNARYSNIDSLIDTTGMDVLSDELVQDIIKAVRNIPVGTSAPGKLVCLVLGGGRIFHSYQLGMCLDLFGLIEETPKMYVKYVSATPRPVAFKSDNCTTLCMPLGKLNPGAKDLVFTLEEALEFKAL